MKKVSLLSLLMLSSCMVGPDYKESEKVSDVDVSEALDITASNVKVNRNLLDFNDNTLDILIDMAIKNNPTYDSALIAARQARANIRIAESKLMPTLSLEAQYDYLKANDETSTLATDDYYELGLDASWELDIWGGNRRGIEATEAKLKAQLYDVRNAYITLTAEVATSYIDYRTTQELIKVTKENIKVQKELTKLVQDKYDTGLVDNLELSQALYLLNSTEASLSALEYDKEMYKNSLALLTGQLPNALDEILDKNKNNVINQRMDYDIKNIYNLPADVVRNRPDVKQQEELLKAENALVGVKLANMYPNVSISAVFGFEFINLGNAFDSSSQVYGYNPVISLPIFNYGALRSEVEKQKDATLIQANTYHNSVLSAASEIKNAMVAINTENTKNAKLRSSYNHAKIATDLNKDKYKSGLVEYSAVLESEQDKISAQNDMVSSNGALYKNIVVFYKSIGG
ncbi:MAG: efflux transporter outer membrane subunit [Alphaproteobacteria bacterium]